MKILIGLDKEETKYHRRHKFAAPLAIHQIADDLNTECMLYNITNFYTFIQEHGGNELPKT